MLSFLSSPSHQCSMFMILTMLDKRVTDINAEGLKLPASSKCREMVENAYIGEVGTKWDMGGNRNHGCFRKNMLGVGLLFRPRDFHHWPARCDTLIPRFMGPTWGPSGADRTQVGPMLAQWTLLSKFIKLKLIDDRIVNTTQNSNFPIFMNFNSLTLRCRLLWWIAEPVIVLNGIIYLFYIFSRHFDREIDDIIVEWRVLSERNTGDKWNTLCWGKMTL